MADLADDAQLIEAEHVAAGLRAIAPIAAGVAGECEGCGYVMPRLINGKCGFCRDGRSPPDDWEPTLPQSKGEDAMPSGFDKRTISVLARGDVLEGIEARSERNQIGLGQAASELIEIALGRTSVVAEPRNWRDTLAALAAALEEAEAKAAAPDRSAEIAALIARAESAEAKLAQLKGMLG